MDLLRIDANGHKLVHHDQRGLRLCEVCNLVMSEGYSDDAGDGYACSDACLIKGEWSISSPIEVDVDGYGKNLIVTPDVLATWDETMLDDEGNVCELIIYWTNWEGDGRPMPEEVGDRLLLEPYNLTTDDLHELGAHEDEADLSCEACSRLHVYEITVPTVIDRKYRVTAESEEQALALYRNGGGYTFEKIALENKGVVFEEDDSSNAQELAEGIEVEVVE